MGHGADAVGEQEKEVSGDCSTPGRMLQCGRSLVLHAVHRTSELLARLSHGTPQETPTECSPPSSLARGGEGARTHRRGGGVSAGGIGHLSRGRLGVRFWHALWAVTRFQGQGGCVTRAHMTVRGGEGWGSRSQLLLISAVLQGGCPEDEAAGLDEEGSAAGPQKDQDVLHTPGAKLPEKPSLACTHSHRVTLSHKH